MHKKVYFDTNVIVDVFDVARPFHQESLHVFKTIFEDEAIDVFINTDTMTNLFYILRSHIKLSFDDAYFSNYEDKLFIYLLQYVKNNLNKFE